MVDDRRLKQAVRARMQETGEKYTKTRRELIADMPCKNANTNICVAEGCYGQSCLKENKDAER